MFYNIYCVSDEKDPRNTLNCSFFTYMQLSFEQEKKDKCTTYNCVGYIGISILNKPNLAVYFCNISTIDQSLVSFFRSPRLHERAHILGKRESGENESFIKIQISLFLECKYFQEDAPQPLVQGLRNYLQRLDKEGFIINISFEITYYWVFLNGKW